MFSHERLEEAEKLIADYVLQFEYYARKHRQKALNADTVEKRCDADQKAQTNEKFADIGRKFLSAK